MDANIYKDKILILDFGSQYTNLIARRVRGLNIYCEIYPFDIDDEAIRKFNPKGIILSGSPESVELNINFSAPEIVFTSGIPVLGICYGMQTMAKQLGGKVDSTKHSEFGYAEVKLEKGSQLLEGIYDKENTLDVWMSHGDQVGNMPEGFKIIANTATCKIAAMEDDLRKFYALQFHPEVTHTKQGIKILERFAKDICGCSGLWNNHNIIENSIEQIQSQVGEEEVILGLSGGVDSSVTAALLHKAIGKQLTCVLVDTGLLRLNESEQVLEMFKESGMKIVLVNAEERFLDALKGVDDPEAKRKVIGGLFIKIFEEESHSIKAKWLAQGTIYPDVIESAASKYGKAHVIKSHHNVGGLPKDMKLKLVEPLRELFKDEVRKIGLELGLEAKMIQRHPFPGPGLGVRILGEIRKEYVDILRVADSIFIEELRAHNLYSQVSQAFAVFLPVKSVGVAGDARKYDWVIALRAVETIDFMTARWAHLPYDFLSLVAQRIINEIKNVSRVVYDISDKPPATIEWE
jgi:GMP synthase (glutamine-hydrolysing)